MQLAPDRTLASLVTAHAGASRVLARHGLDFCCGGSATLADACQRAGQNVDELLLELEQELGRSDQPTPPWEEMPLVQLVEHILVTFHEPHRQELPRLIGLARKVDHAHSAHPDRPVELVRHLEEMLAAMEEHMQKEEQVLFPMIVAGRGRQASMPVQCMEAEHRDHGANLERLRAMACDYSPPADACNTWRALYLGLAEFERELMEHVHLENNVLFPRALRG